MKLDKFKHTIALYAFLLVVWGFYRLLFQFPEEIEILIIKPLVWLVPTFYLVKKEKENIQSLGVTTKNLFPTLYFAIFLGAVFLMEGLFVNYLKHGAFSFGANIGSIPVLGAVFLSFATALSEEITFRGFIFTRIWQNLKSEWTANILTSVGWTLIHLPIAVLDWKLGLSELLTYSLLVMFFSLGASFIFARTRNVFASVFLHVLWQWPIILFR